MRPEIGFTPAWFHAHCGIDFSRRWHEDPDYRLEAYAIMRDEIRRRFPGRDIGGVPFSDPPIARHELVWENLRLRLGQAAERAMTDTDDPADVYDEKYVNVGVVERFDTSTDPDCGL